MLHDVLDAPFLHRSGEFDKGAEGEQLPLAEDALNQHFATVELSSVRVHAPSENPSYVFNWIQIGGLRWPRHHVDTVGLEPNLGTTSRVDRRVVLLEDVARGWLARANGSRNCSRVLW